MNLLLNQYTSIGGQAVIEGVMMRSPHSFVIAVRKKDGKIKIRRDQWFGLSSKYDFLKKPFLRGVLMMVEAMANGVVALNFSANEAAEDEAQASGKKIKKKQNEKVDWTTFLTMLVSFAMGIALFVFLPHALSFGVGKLFGQSWDLNSFAFHAVDGTIKACIFILYIYLISFFPDVKRVFQYHGAEHKSIATFEADQALNVENASKFSTLHPRCGTSFLFFLIFISIILFSIFFVFLPLPSDLPVVVKHLIAMLIKMILMFPIAGISYEVIKFAGKNADKSYCRWISKPGMMLQKITTSEPDAQQLEVALASIRTAILLEKKYNLQTATAKVFTQDIIEIEKLEDLEPIEASVGEFLE